jgi:hypothetical protein
MRLRTAFLALTLLVAAAVLVPAAPAQAFVAQVATSIPSAAIDTDAQLQAAVAAAVKDIIKQAIAFSPSLVELQSARQVGDRIYILLLLADPDGEETLKAFETADAARE